MSDLETGERWVKGEEQMLSYREPAMRGCTIIQRGVAKLTM